MEQNVLKFHVSMHDIMLLHVNNTANKLLHNSPSLFLLKRSSLLEQGGQVKAIGVLLDHVDFFRRLDCLIMLYAVGTGHHAVYLDLSQNLLEILLLITCDIEGLARINFLCLVNC